MIKDVEDKDFPKPKDQYDEVDYKMLGKMLKPSAYLNVHILSQVIPL